MASSQKIARVKIMLDDVEPRVWRRIDVPFTIKLDRLHLVIQTAMGWTNSHLWEFEAGGMRWGEAGLGFDDDSQPASKATLQSVVKEVGTKTLHYTYDFGDGWEHTIKLEDLRDRVPDTLYPCMLKAEGRCPPEDIGGVPGYENYLQIIADPDDDEYDEMIEFYGDHGDLALADIDILVSEVERLAKWWLRRKS